jgi:beta-lactamase class A
MKSLTTFLLLIMPALSGADSLAGFGPVTRSPGLQGALDRAVAQVLAHRWKTPLATNELASTVVDISSPERISMASVRGDEAIYPASVIKLFYLAAVHHGLEQGRLNDTAELRRAARDMIVESYNEPTHYLIDLLTDTTSGPELSDADLRTWWDKRNAVNRHFFALGYPTNINASKKPWCEGPYGRETQAIKAYQPNRNMLTTDATARLVAEIALGRCVSAARSTQMLELMKRDFQSPADDPEDQAHGYTGITLKAGDRLWSKCGLTSQTRHDAALIETAAGRRLVIVTFTTGHSNERDIIPTLARHVLDHLPQ